MEYLRTAKNHKKLILSLLTQFWEKCNYQLVANENTENFSK